MTKEYEIKKEILPNGDEKVSVVLKPSEKKKVSKSSNTK